MNFTDAELLKLCDICKIINKKSKERSLNGHSGRDFSLSDTEGNQYVLFIRQNERIENNFSCGLRLVLNSGEKVTLARYNGSDHPHFNPIEKTRFSNESHIHIATERYIAIGRKSEHYAETTNRYTTSKGALHCLVMDYHITGIETEAEQTELF